MLNNSSSISDVASITCSLSYQSMTLDDIETLYDVSVATSVINALTMILAIAANGLVLAAVLGSQILHSPSNVLICCLATTDILTGLVTQPLFIMSHIARIQGNRDLYCFSTFGFSITVAILSIVSFLTFTAVSVNRFLVLHLHMRYSELVTNRRVILLAVCCWVLCVLEVSLTIPHGFYMTHFVVLVLFLSSGVIITLAAYWRIFHVIRKYEKTYKAEQKLSIHLHENSEADKNPTGDVLKQGKVSRTMALISALFLLCYLPYIGVLVANVAYISHITRHVSLKIAGNVTFTVVLGNSALNPFLYLQRMREIRKAVIDVLKRWHLWLPNNSSGGRVVFTERKETFSCESPEYSRSRNLCMVNHRRGVCRRQKTSQDPGLQL